MPANVAEKIITDYAAAKGLTPTRLNDRVVLTESREADWPDRRVLMHYWQVGVGRIFVVCSATIWGADRESKTVRQTLACVSSIIQSLRLIRIANPDSTPAP